MSSNDSLELIKGALASAGVASPEDVLQKAWLQPGSATTGLQVYDLEAPAKLLYPVLTPLRNAIPRVGGGKGIQANWRAITAINANNISGGLGQGNRGGVISTTTKEYLAAFRGLGFDDYVTFEADMSAEGFQDLKATAVQGLLRSLMIYEERTILAGNGSVALGTTPTPTLTAIGNGGSIATGTAVYVGCVALTAEGFRTASMANGVNGQITRTNADGSTETYGGGSAAPSALATVTTGANSSRVSAHVAPVQGAVAYAWYVGGSNAAASCYLAAITTINSAVFSAIPGGTTQAMSAISGDNSVNSLLFSGLMYLAAASGSGAIWSAQPTGTDGTGTPLTTDGSGGIVEFDTILQNLWDNLRLSPSEIWVGSQEINYLRKKVLASTGSTPNLVRFTVSTAQDRVTGGTGIRGYLNPFGMGQAVEIPIKLHPDMPNGTVMFVTHELPYSLSGVTNVMQMKMRRDYYQIEWPLRSRKYEYGVYTDAVLQHYFTPSIAVLTNIAPG